MATSSLNCNVCELRHVSKHSVIWCTECDEGLCEGCKEHHSLSKGSRNHTVISISEYNKLPNDVIKISQFCDKHNEKYTIYCKKHECPCCSSCIVQSHNKCDDIVKLDDVVYNAKTSNAFHEIEQTLLEVTENIEKIRKDRQTNLDSLSETRKQIEKEIQETRKAINNHIDKIQADVIKELCASEDKESKKIRQLLNSLKEKQQEIAILQKNISDIKQHASDLQTFLSMKRFEKEVTGKEEYIRAISCKEILKNIVLSFNINTAVQNLISGTQNFGKIMVENIPSNIELTTRKQKQAQMLVTKIPSRSFENINLKLQQTMSMYNDTFGTYLLSDGRMVFCRKFYFINSIIVLNAKGSLDFEVNLRSSAFDVAYITEDNTLAVSSGSSDAQCIYIIDMENQKIKKTIPVHGRLCGITYHASRLIYSEWNEGVRMINPNDEIISDIVKDEMPTDCYVATFGDKLFTTNPNTNSVKCCDLQGKMQWTYQDTNVLLKPGGISVDNSGNIYVVGRKSNNLIIISPDGKQHRQLLSAKEGLSEPCAIHFSRERNMLIVANIRGKAFLYSVN